MKYITLDLEWNQAYVQKAIAVQKRLSARLRGEVIQIGAVMMDEKKQICGSFSIIVRPQYFCKIHRHVRDLTGITQEMMDKGVHLSDAILKFKQWCQDDFVFLTWGPDDIPMLKENLAVHAIDSEWLDNVYDLQAIFGTQTEGSKQQRSLEYAMDYFEIEQTLPSHDALNDAFFTALVSQKLNLAEGIEKYNSNEENYLFDQTYGDSNIGEDGYVEISEFFEEDETKPLECPICHEVLKNKNKTLHCKGHRYLTLYSCKEHGDIFLQVKMYKNFDDTWRARKTLFEAEREEIKEYLRRLEENEERRQRRRKARKGSSQKKSKESSTASNEAQVEALSV